MTLRNYSLWVVNVLVSRHAGDMYKLDAWHCDGGQYPETLRNVVMVTWEEICSRETQLEDSERLGKDWLWLGTYVILTNMELKATYDVGCLSLIEIKNILFRCLFIANMKSSWCQMLLETKLLKNQNKFCLVE